MLSALRWTVLLCLTVAGCFRGARASADTTVVASFEWFEYTGADPVYEEVAAREGTYLNPILAGFHPDPSIVRVREDFYLVTSTFAYFPGIPIFHSRDLVSWTQVGHVLDRPSQLNLDGLAISEGIFAPTIEHHQGTYYVLSTLVGAGGNFVVTASRPAGPWSDPIWLPEVDGIDPSIFFDDDGKAFILNNGPPEGEPLYEGHRALWIQEFDLDARETVGRRTMIVDGGADISQEPIWIEGPHLYKVEGQYLLSAAEGGTGEWHSQVVFRSDDILGPYEPYEANPFLTQRHLDPSRSNPVTSVGHADLVETQNGDWWAVFLGTRPYDGGHYNTGRETFLMPVRWIDGWPAITVADETVPLVHERPTLPRQAEPEVSTSGNFVVRDEFDEPLAPYWSFIRTPREDWFEVDGGSLSLVPRPDHIGSLAQPSFIGRRQQHAHATASAAISFHPAGVGEAAGLVAFQNEDHYYFLAVANDSGRTVVRLEMAHGESSGARAEVIASELVDLPRDAPVYLRIEAKGPLYDFYYGFRDGDWIPLKVGADGTILSTRTAGGFVGTFLGMYAYAPPR